MESPPVKGLDPSTFPTEWVVLAVLAAAIEGRRTAFRSRARFGIALVEGPRFVIDPAASTIVSTQWRDDTEVLILTNRKTLEDLARGEFDPKHPGPEHVFLWSGFRPALAELARALSPGRSMIALRASKS